MKGWVAALTWFGLGCGIGVFGGYQIGKREKGKAERMAYESGRSDGFYDCACNEGEYLERFEKVRKEYEGLSEEPEPPEEDPEMPEETPVIGDEEYVEKEIPQLHPQHFIPKQIDDEEFFRNEWHYDVEELLFYEVNQVLYNRTTREKLTAKDDIDQAIGVGMTYQFYVGDGEPLDTIFVRNDTNGVLYRIDRIDAEYDDPISGADAPDYEEDDEE